MATRSRAASWSAAATAAAKSASTSTRSKNGSGDDIEQHDKMAARKFEAEGWRIGTTAAKHRCPDCIREARAAQMRYLHANKEKPMGAENVVPMPPKAEPPREMSRADRRVIFAKLEEVYVDEVSGYRPGWTDQRVADDLGTPVAWVRVVRDENFGPIASNPEIDKLMAEARTFRTEATKLLEEGTSLETAFHKHAADLKRLAIFGESMDRRLFEIEKALCK
jgi:hypothetical protein